MYPQQPNNSFIIRSAVLLFFIVAITFAAMLVFRDKAMPQNFVTQDTTKSTTITPKKSIEPTFNNFDALTERGLSIDQSTGLKYAFTKYNQTLDTPIRSVTLDEKTILIPAYDRNKPATNSIMSFDVSLDDTPYKVRIEYSGLANIWLFLFKADGTPVYESGLVNINTQAPN